MLDRALAIQRSLTWSERPAIERSRGSKP
jgi:hypothetical protein